MLERYFIRPETVDRIRNCWLGEEIQTYVAWAYRAVVHRTLRGPSRAALHAVRRVCPQAWRRTHRGFARPPRCLRAVLPSSSDQSLCFEAYPAAVRFVACVDQSSSFSASFRRADFEPATRPFRDWAPGFFEYLREERGLRPTTVDGYSVQLARFEEYIAARRLTPNTLSPAVLDGFSPSDVSTSAPAPSARRAPLFERSCDTCSGRRPSATTLALWSTARGTYRLSQIPRAISVTDV